MNFERKLRPYTEKEARQREEEINAKIEALEKSVVDNSKRNEEEKQKKEVQFNLTGEQKFLILHYLGFGDEIKTKTKKAVLFNLYLVTVNK